MQNLLGGFQAVSREKLKALPGDTLAELAATNELELIYLRLQNRCGTSKRCATGW